MNKNTSFTIGAFCILLCVLFINRLQAQDISLKIHIRGVYETKISVIPLTGSNAFKPIIEKTGIKNGDVSTIIVPKEYVPGEFVIQFDYKEKISSTPYPSEKGMIIGHQNLELWVNPPFCNNLDSTYFQKEEKENALFERFTKENNKQKEKLGLLQNFLISYDDTQSKFYKLGIEEYENRRTVYNQWIIDMANQNKNLFASSTFRFQYVPQVVFEGSETDRMSSVLAHYFDGIDFSDTLILRTSSLTEWMNAYVNIYGSMAKSQALVDSLFSAAGKNAIEKAKKGHPLVYGWMVDYFYKGYEANGIDAGMKILEPYINDPNCLTSKQLEINKRLQGINTLVEGVKAPEIALKDANNKLFELKMVESEFQYVLILFWSAGCSHCAETVDMLYPWSTKAEIKQKLKVVAISLDDNDEDIAKWHTEIKKLDGWKHLQTETGVNSKVANDYYILSTPVMFLLENKTKTIKASPNGFSQLVKYFEK